MRPPGSDGGCFFKVLLAQLLEYFAVAISQNAAVGKSEMGQRVRFFQRAKRGLILTIVVFHSLRNAKARARRAMFGSVELRFSGWESHLAPIYTLSVKTKASI